MSDRYKKKLTEFIDDCGLCEYIKAETPSGPALYGVRKVRERDEGYTRKAERFDAILASDVNQVLKRYASNF